VGVFGTHVDWPAPVTSIGATPSDTVVLVTVSNELTRLFSKT
jgi:hypothetical protein